MPGAISVYDFVRETREDYSSPTTSNFVTRIPQCKEAVTKLEEGLASDKEGLIKLKNSVKEISKTGNSHVTSQMEFTKALNRLGESAIMRDDEPDDIGAAFQKFAVVTKELALLMKNLMQNLDSIIMFPVDRLLKTELRGSKGDLKRPFDRAWKDYHDKFSELERQKKKAAKEAGLFRSEFTAGEIAEEMEKERKYLQLTTADYLIKVNEIRTKKSVDLLQHLLEYYHAQYKYFKEGLDTIEHFGTYIEDLMNRLSHIKTEQEEEKKDLIDIRNTLKNSPGFNKLGGGQSQGPYSLHPLKGMASAGNTKSGSLNKRSEGRLRNVWQKRRCQVADGILHIYHADESKPPTKVNLLTCQMKPVPEDCLCFDVVSYNRTYHFQAENETDCKEWMSVMLNSKEAALHAEFQNNGETNVNPCFLELQRALVGYIRTLPGNEKCCDCDSTNDATWLSTNLGIIVCIECSGIHREMGVHISKIQSLTLDNIGTSQLLVSRLMSNDGFNKIMEAFPVNKPNPNSTMEERKAYIKAKYEEKRFVHSYCSNAQDVYAELEQAIASHNLYDLLQAYAEAASHGVDLTDPLPGSEFAETSLHYAISHETGHSLHIVDFIVQNSSSLDKQTREGNTPLHYCVIQNQCESMRLLLRSGANPGTENKNGKTPLSIATERGFQLCQELLEHALQRKKTMFENVNIDWHISHDDGSTDFSDDETLDPDNSTMTIGRTNGMTNTLSPNKSKSGLRPMSTVQTGFSPPSNNNNNNNNNKNDWDRTLASDWSRSDSNSGGSPNSGRIMPPPPPPSSKKPPLFSGSSIGTHMVGSLKKGPKSNSSSSKPLPANLSYNTLPAQHLHHNLRTSTSSPRFIPLSSTPSSTPTSATTVKPLHKRSPSTDSGTGSNTPVSSYQSNSGGKSGHHTVYLRVGSKSSASSDTSPPLQSFAEESSPENRVSPSSPTSHLSGGHHRGGRIRSAQSTESLDSFSDESAGAHHQLQLRNSSSSSAVGHRGRAVRSSILNPVPPPRRRIGERRCRALYDCEADNDDELTFEEGDVIVITNEETEDENWMEGHLLSDPNRRGLFPVSFVQLIPE